MYSYISYKANTVLLIFMILMIATLKQYLDSMKRKILLCESYNRNKLRMLMVTEAEIAKVALGTTTTYFIYSNLEML